MKAVKYAIFDPATGAMKQHGICMDNVVQHMQTIGIFVELPATVALDPRSVYNLQTNQIEVPSD